MSAHVFKLSRCQEGEHAYKFNSEPGPTVWKCEKCGSIISVERAFEFGPTIEIPPEAVGLPPADPNEKPVKMRITGVDPEKGIVTVTGDDDPTA